MKSKNSVLSLLALMILAALAFILYNSREIFYYQYEPEYTENLYYHSQWNIPGSVRGISDGTLYKFVGYRLAEGENPFNINPETPPFGKLLFGLAEKYWGNPYWVSLFFYLASVGVIFLLLKDLFRDKRAVFISLLLFVTTPFVATQLRDTMLDLPVMFLYLAHLWFFLRYLSKPHLKWIIFAGIFLGLAAGTKLGLYTPFILLLGSGLMFTRRRSIWLLAYPVSAVLGYLLAYISYFLQHPNPLPWLRLHEKIYQTYGGLSLQVDHLNQWKTIFLNSYHGWWQEEQIGVGDWSWLLPLGVVATLVVFVLALKKRQVEWIYISALAAIFLGVNSFIPFWPRYLIPVLPLFILMITYLLCRINLAILLLVLLNLPLLVGTFTADGLTGHADATSRAFSLRAYRELYRSITPEQRKVIPEDKFIEVSEDFFNKLGVRSISMSVEDVTRVREGAKVKYRMKYFTRFGEIDYEQVLEFAKTDNRLGLIWKWDYLWPGYNPDNKIVVIEGDIPLLRVEDNQGRVLMERSQGKEVYIIPRLMFDWGKALNSLSEVVGESSLDVGEKMKVVIPDKYPRFAGYLNPILGEEGSKKALAIPGASLRDTSVVAMVSDAYKPDHLVRILGDLRKRQPELFFPQVEIYIENNKGEKIVIPVKQIKQKDVIIKI